MPASLRSRLIRGLGVLLTAWLLAYAVARAIGPQPPRVLFDERLDAAHLDTIPIAPVSEALTFARIPAADGAPARAIRVLRYERGVVSGVDLGAALPAGADPVSAFAALGYDRLAALQGPAVEVPAAQLAVPFDARPLQVAAGVNYPEHGREVQVESSFVFPKPAPATGHRSTIEGRWELLDYELELGFVALQPLARGAAPATMGLVLAADYTDRAALLRLLRLTDVESGDGFPVAKGGPAFMPVGNLFVIPRDLAAFVGSLELKLWVNGGLRQRIEPRRMTWPIERIVDETFARAATTFRSGTQAHRLPVEGERIPAGTIVLSGTPDGVLFQGLDLRQRFLGGSELVAGVHGWRLQALVEPYVRESLAARHYLQPGDTVAMRADRLGVIVNRIGAPGGPLR